ncbi:hypothetical protein GJV44_00702 [Candidatus Vallotia cooleyia]|nr:hypothetical protein GJV44_00702 [Candidatus Vallotia cooleyia]
MHEDYNSLAPSILKTFISSLSTLTLKLFQNIILDVMLYVCGSHTSETRPTNEFERPQTFILRLAQATYCRRHKLS